MQPLAGRAEFTAQPRGRRPPDQAHAPLSRTLVLTLGLVLLAPGCGGRAPDLPGTFGRIFGPATEGREPPPGLDGPYPSLGSVPERPARPTPGQRQAVTDALAAERALAARPLAPGQFRSPGRTGTEGDAAVPLGPPRPPTLTTAPPVMAEPPPAAAPSPLAPAVAPPSTAPAVPAPTREETPPAATISPGPPPPPPPSLLTPGAAPPPPPTPDLMSPSPRGR